MSDVDDLLPDAPSVEEFTVQLIDSLMSDLDGVLADGQLAAPQARALLFSAAATGDARAATLPALLRAAVAAHTALLDDDDATLPAPDVERVSTLCATLLPGDTTTQRQLLDAEARLQAHYAAAEPQRPAPWQSLAQAIHRLYDGMRVGDERLAGNGLLELRALLVTLDASACALRAEPELPPYRAIRPDRFHDLYLRYVDTARTGGDAQQAVATVRQDGRIAAIVTETAHPVAVAELALRDAFGDDHPAADAALARVRALIRFLDTRRRLATPASEDDAAETLSLIVAAATAPLHGDGSYSAFELLQIARYNRQLLSTAPPGAAAAARSQH